MSQPNEQSALNQALDRLEGLEKAATPGPWFSTPWGSGVNAGWHAVTAFGDNLIANVHPAEEENDPNRELGTTDHLVIPALRNAAPGLIALVRAYAERDVAYDAYHTVTSEPHGELSREEITDRYLSVNAAYLAAEKTLDAALTAFLEGSK